MSSIEIYRHQNAGGLVTVQWCKRGRHSAAPCWMVSWSDQLPDGRGLWNPWEEEFSSEQKALRVAKRKQRQLLAAVDAVPVYLGL